jgi:hypothetical protein
LIEVADPGIVLLPHTSKPGGIDFDLAIHFRETVCELYQCQVAVFRGIGPLVLGLKPAVEVLRLAELFDEFRRPTLVILEA